MLNPIPSFQSKKKGKKEKKKEKENKTRIKRSLVL